MQVGPPGGVSAAYTPSPWADPKPAIDQANKINATLAEYSTHRQAEAAWDIKARSTDNLALKMQYTMNAMEESKKALDAYMNAYTDAGALYAMRDTYPSVKEAFGHLYDAITNQLPESQAAAALQSASNEIIQALSGNKL